MITLGLFSYGGVEELTVDAVIREFAHASQHGEGLSYQRISGDALISRSRSRALGGFYKRGKSGDVLVMVDHDISWRPGDLCQIAKESLEHKALVGGLYCKRAFKKGWSSRVPASGQVTFGQPGLIATDSLATGFLAIPWDVAHTLVQKLEFTGDAFQKIFKEAIDSGKTEDIRQLADLSIAPIADGAWKKIEHEYYDFFRCIRVPSANVKAKSNQFISEDWAFSMRCIHCGVDSYLSTTPVLVHHGQHGFTIPDGMDDNAVKEQDAAQNNTSNTKGQVPGAGGAQK